MRPTEMQAAKAIHSKAAQSIKKRVGRLDLWPKLALIISFGLLAMYITFSLLGERAVRESTTLINEHVQVIAHMASARLDQLIEEEIDELQQSEINAPFDPNDPYFQQEADRLENTFMQLGEFTPGFIFITPEGIVAASRPEGLFSPGTNLTDQDHIEMALKRLKPTISEPFFLQGTHQPVFALVVPKIEDGHLIGLLCGLVSLDRKEIVSTLLDVKAIGNTSNAALLDSRGRVLASSSARTFHSGDVLPGNYLGMIARGEPIVFMVQPENSFFVGNGASSKVVAFSPLRTTTWGVEVETRIEETYSAINRLRIGLAFLGIIALGAIWGGTLIGAHRLVKPIQEITTAAREITAGNLHTTIQTSDKKNEAQVMASALENMRLQLLRSIEKLTGLNQNLEARVEQKTADLQRQQALTRQLLRRILTAQEEERARLARDLHDELGQLLTAIETRLHLIGNDPLVNRAGSAAKIEKVRNIAEEAVVELRHIIGAMRPGVLDDLGLIPALAQIARQSLRPLKIDVHFDSDDAGGRLSEEIEITIFRISQEAIHNIARHSQARQVNMRLYQESGNVRLTIQDDGKGWDKEPVGSFHTNSWNVGLTSMRERALLIGGHLEITSESGTGTRIELTIPIPDHGEKTNV